MSEERLRRELYEAHGYRAIVYYYLFQELKREIGADRAEAIMKRAIFRCALDTNAHPVMPSDMVGLRDFFLGVLPDEGYLHKPEVLRCDGEGLDIKIHRCPAVEAWRRAGVPEKEVSRMCRIADAMMDAIFGRDYEFWGDHVGPEREKCTYHFRPKKKDKVFSDEQKLTKP